MEIVDIKTVIGKWEITGEGFEAPTKEGERPGFLVGRYMGGNRNCIISAEIQITTQETTFILDLSIESNIEFTNDKTPTSEEIYELYKDAKAKWRNEILLRGRKEGYNNPMILIGFGLTPFHVLKPVIEKAIAQSLQQNN